MWPSPEHCLRLLCPIDNITEEYQAQRTILCRKRVIESNIQVMLSNATRRVLFLPTDTHLHSPCRLPRRHICTSTLFYSRLWPCRLLRLRTDQIHKGCSLWQINRYMYVLYPQLAATLICPICLFAQLICYTGLQYGQETISLIEKNCRRGKPANTTGYEESWMLK